MKHHFTVDVEEYFHVSAMEPYVAPEQWESFESRVEAPVDRLLELLEEAGAAATFFVLGWVGERRPALVRRIAEAGHEVASHGQRHRRVTTLTSKEFGESVRRSKALLEDACGRSVVGYRAPSFSIVPGLEWAFDVLLEEGYLYDSSVLPMARRGSGYPGAAPDPHRLGRPGGELIEVPPGATRWLGAVDTACGGAYFRLFPYAAVASALRAAERRGAPGTFYVHPWELDPDQPRLPVSVRTRVRHYGGLSRTEPRLRRLLREFSFTDIRSNVVGDVAPAAPAQAAAPVASAG